MAAAFEALGDFLDDYLELPVVGRDGVERVYRVESPPADDGLRVSRITTLAARVMAGGADPTQEQLDDAAELDLYRMCLGDDVYERLQAEASWSRFKMAALTAMYWITADRETAHAYWAAGGDPSRLAPNRAARRQAKPGSSGSAAANTTQSRGSTSGTKAGSHRSGKGRKGRR